MAVSVLWSLIQKAVFAAILLVCVSHMYSASHKGNLPTYLAYSSINYYFTYNTLFSKDVSLIVYLCQIPVSDSQTS